MHPAIFVFGTERRYANYKRAVEAAGGKIRFSTDLADAHGCRALLLPGGGDLEPWRYGQGNTASGGLEPERDEAEFRLLEQFTAAGKPVLGICRGVQAINVWFGGTLRQDLPGHRAVGGADSFHRVHTEPSFLSDICGTDCPVNSAHHQAVDRLGRGLQAAQWSEDGVTEGLFCRETPVWGVQWHPERMPGRTGACLFRAFLACCRRSGDSLD